MQDRIGSATDKLVGVVNDLKASSYWFQSKMSSSKSAHEFGSDQCNAPTLINNCPLLLLKLSLSSLVWSCLAGRPKVRASAA